MPASRTVLAAWENPVVEAPSITAASAMTSDTRAPIPEAAASTTATLKCS